MKKKLLHQTNTFIIALFLAIACFVAINILYYFTFWSVIEERDSQLYSLAYSVDNNLLEKLNDLSGELYYTIRRPEYIKIEDGLMDEGDRFLITRFFTKSHLFKSPELEGIVVFDESSGKQMYSLNQNNLSTEHQYTFVKDGNHDDLYICYDQHGKYSIALKNPSSRHGYSYYMLVDLDHFFDNIVPEMLQDSHWIVFYMPESGLLLQNHDNQDPWMILSEEEILERNDGYSIILKNQINNRVDAQTYSYANYQGKVVPERIITLPRQQTANGYFAIGISRDSGVFYHKLNLFKNLMIIIMILLLLCAILSIRHQLYNRQRELKAKHLIETQEKERELLEERVKKEELMKTLAETQVQNSIRQLQPHFLYNALSSIREIVLEAPEYAADLLMDFTVYLRSCLRALSTKDLIPFEQELNNINAYVNIEKMRLGERLTVEYDIAETAFSIIPLGVQPLVENAIRHGISKKRYKTGTVKIQTYKENDCIIIRVEDNGTGFNVEEVFAEIASEKRDSTGITSLRLRYEKQMNAVLECSSEEGKGTKVCIRIPVE